MRCSLPYHWDLFNDSIVSRLTLTGYTSLTGVTEVIVDRLKCLDVDEEIRQTFKAFDVSCTSLRYRHGAILAHTRMLSALAGCGFLRLDDLKRVCKEVMPWLPQQTVEEIFFEADSDRDGACGCI